MIIIWDAENCFWFGLDILGQEKDIFIQNNLLHGLQLWSGCYGLSWTVMDDF